MNKRKKFVLQFIRRFERKISKEDKWNFRMLLTRAVRPDRLILAAKSFVQSVFGMEFVQRADALLNFEQIITEEVINNFISTRTECSFSNRFKV